jgi:acyl carrier protein
MDEKILEIISNKFQKQVSKQTALMELAEDSFGLIELVMEMETHFKVTLNEEEFLNLENIDDLIQMIKKK